MTVLDYLFDKCNSDEVVNEAEYPYYTVYPDNTVIMLKHNKRLEEIEEFELDEFNNFVEEFFDANIFYSTPCFIEYEKLKPFMCMYIEGDVYSYSTDTVRNQFITIRGTCNHQCSSCSDKRDGYALRKLPCCNQDLVGTTLWTAKYATPLDLLQDIFWWMLRCRGLDVLVYNWGMSVDSSLHYENICLAVHINGNTVRQLPKSEYKKKFLEYSEKYECMDYKIEDAIRINSKDDSFSLPKPKKLKGEPIL